MDTGLDTLAVALYVTIDDLLNSHPDRAPRRPPGGFTPQISDAELLTLAVIASLLQISSERCWLRHANTHLRHMFPYLPQQPGYNKRLRQLAATMAWLTGQLGGQVRVAGDDVWVGRPPNAPIWLGGLNTVTAQVILATSGGYGCT